MNKWQEVSVKLLKNLKKKEIEQILLHKKILKIISIVQDRQWMWIISGIVLIFLKRKIIIIYLMKIIWQLKMVFVMLQIKEIIILIIQ